MTISDELKIIIKGDDVVAPVFNKKRSGDGQLRWISSYFPVRFKKGVEVPGNGDGKYILYDVKGFMSVYEDAYSNNVPYIMITGYEDVDRD